ncbi:MAG: serine hydrolase [Bacteroidales bacterium]|jgi:beta-glucosidase-like glycosyl hydrolase/CubicO group peptidase (beta-lactamase class C family)|nr:serine hydrolase [Bacteroidales bacterium]
MMKRKICILVWCCAIAPLFAQVEKINPVDEVLKNLTLEEKIAQLIVIRSDAQGNTAYFARIAESIKQYGIGGVCFFKGTPHGLVYANNLYQATSKIPLMVSIDGEWGVAMRLDSVTAFPRQQTLGALQDDYLVFEMGELVAEQCNRLGIHVNFVPCVDVNSNPKNPVINTRSFGENRINVANKGIAYMQGLQSKNVFASAKHFPGHGDTDVDSHYDLPVIKHSFERIDSIDLFPFKMLIRNGVKSVMIAHLNIPAMDKSRYPSSVSKFIVDTLLKQNMGFNGLVFTDGLEMEGFTKFGTNGEMELRALEAGVDILLLPINTERTINTIADAVRSGRISEDLIDEKCRKVLQTKYDLGILHQAPIVSFENLLQDLNTDRVTQLNQKIYANAITVLENKNAILPINPEKYRRIANINIGDTKPNLFQKTVSEYSSSTTFNFHRDFSEKSIDSIVRLFEKNDLLIVSVTNTNINARRNYGVTPQTIQLIRRLQIPGKPMVLTIFASPYVLSSFPKNFSTDGLVIAYQEQQTALEMAAHGIFGTSAMKGRLPVTASERYPIFSGLPLKQARLAAVTNTSDTLFSAIDARLQKAIVDSVFPGCQVLVAKDGKIVYNKAFGSHTYEDMLQNVKLADIYDVASVTKVAATTLALMKLYDEGKFKMNDKLSTHLPYLKNTNKADMTIRQVLGHQAGLRPSIHTHRNDTLFSTTRDSVFFIQVAEGFYTSKAALDTLRKHIVESPLIPNRPYRYSDLGFYLIAELIQQLSGQTLDEYVTENFYKPLKLSHTTFHPTQQFPLSQIIPTEDDTVFRKQLIHGFVHDPTVAMLGGVGGSAGLFSNAEDLAVIMQMLLNRGEYNGQRYISEQTIDLFTQRILPNNRRGAGFDKPADDPTKSPAAESASKKSFGHSGFTGTLVWADPENQLIFIFLSNRVHPTAANNKLLRENFRPELQQMFYDTLR